MNYNSREPALTQDPRHLNDRIKDLVNKVCESKDSDEAGKLLLELQAALREHVESLRQLAVDKLGRR